MNNEDEFHFPDEIEKNEEVQQSAKKINHFLYILRNAKIWGEISITAQDQIYYPIQIFVGVKAEKDVKTGAIATILAENSGDVKFHIGATKEFLAYYEEKLRKYCTENGFFFFPFVREAE